MKPSRRVKPIPRSPGRPRPFSRSGPRGQHPILLRPEFLRTGYKPAIRAATQRRVSTVLLGGGVVANTRLRERIEAEGAASGLRVLFPPIELCTDNAAMIAVTGADRLARGERTALDVGADANLRLAS